MVLGDRVVVKGHQSGLCEDCTVGIHITCVVTPHTQCIV